MRRSYSSLMQSKYFSPAFNSAIIDGPFRIYFAQFHETQALKIYFMIQQQLSQRLPEIKEYSKLNCRNILIMLYPAHKMFLEVFSESNGLDVNIILDIWQNDFIIGANQVTEDKTLSEIMGMIGETVKNWSVNKVSSNKNNNMIINDLVNIEYS